jgi:hypothetical protein
LKVSRRRRPSRTPKVQVRIVRYPP